MKEVYIMGGVIIAVGVGIYAMESKRRRQEEERRLRAQTLAMQTAGTGLGASAGGALSGLLGLFGQGSDTPKGVQNGQQVKDIQTAVNSYRVAKGITPLLATDGIWGPQTEAGVKQLIPNATKETITVAQVQAAVNAALQ